MGQVDDRVRWLEEDVRAARNENERLRSLCHELLRKRNVATQAEFARCRDFVAKEHHSIGQHGDDRCWLDDVKLYEFFGLPPCDNHIGDPDAMLANCNRFVKHRCAAGGGWPSYADMEAEIAKLKAENTSLKKENEELNSILDGESSRWEYD